MTGALGLAAHPPARLRRVLIAVHVVEAVHRVRALGAQDQRAVVAREQRDRRRRQALNRIVAATRGNHGRTSIGARTVHPSPDMLTTQFLIGSMNKQE
jgi:hypothetical protein